MARQTTQKPNIDTTPDTVEQPSSGAYVYDEVTIPEAPSKGTEKVNPHADGVARVKAYMADDATKGKGLAITVEARRVNKETAALRAAGIKDDVSIRTAFYDGETRLTSAPGQFDEMPADKPIRIVFWAIPRVTRERKPAPAASAPADASQVAG